MIIPMMTFTEIAFAYLAPLLILAGWLLPAPYKQWARGMLAAASLTLILNSIFLVQQLIAMAKWAAELARMAGISLEDMPPFQPDLFFFRLMTMIFLPWIFLIRPLRNSPWLAMILLVVIYAGGTASQNTHWLGMKCLWMISLLCAVYALLWLLKELPFQRMKQKV